jgi:putative addiction module component (TIGR02574 family)
MTSQVAEILELSVAERIRIVGEIWDSIASNPDTLLLSDEERADLDDRLLEYEKNPTEGIEWNDIKLKFFKI